MEQEEAGRGAGYGAASAGLPLACRWGRVRRREVGAAGCAQKGKIKVQCHGVVSLRPELVGAGLGLSGLLKGVVQEKQKRTGDGEKGLLV